jgi:hypothetical protein
MEWSLLRTTRDIPLPQEIPKVLGTLCQKPQKPNIFLDKLQPLKYLLRKKKVTYENPFSL